MRAEDWLLRKSSFPEVFLLTGEGSRIILEISIPDQKRSGAARLDENILGVDFKPLHFPKCSGFFVHRRNPPLKEKRKGGVKR